MNANIKKSIAVILVVVVVYMLTYSTASNLLNWESSENIGYNIVPIAIIMVGIYVIYRIVKKKM